MMTTPLSAPSSSRGFSLIESVAALAIVALAVTTMWETGRGIEHNAIYAARSQTATWLGNEILSRAMMGEFAENGFPEQDGETTTYTFDMDPGDDRFFESEEDWGGGRFPYKSYTVTIERTLTADPLGRDTTTTTGAIEEVDPEGEEEEEEPTIFLMRVAVIVEFPDPTVADNASEEGGTSSFNETADGILKNKVTVVTFDFPPNDIVNSATEYLEQANGGGNNNPTQ